VLGVALGVASVSSIQLINQNAIDAFRAGMDVVSGPADLSVVGVDASFSETLYPDVLSEAGVERAWASTRATVALKRAEPYYLQIIGMDFFAAPAGRWRAASFDLAGALSVVGWTAITPELARDLALKKNDDISVSLGSTAHRLRVGEIIDIQKWTPSASRKIVFMDISQAQSMFGKPGQINQIDIQLRPGTDSHEFAQRLAKKLGPTVDVLTSRERENKAVALMGAFRLNLTALSLISLFVGVFLVFSTTQAALLRRRREWGLLRSVGAGRGQLLALILGEAVTLGALGVLVGIPLGLLAAKSNLHSVSETISNLYILSEIDHLSVPSWIYAVSAAIGLGAALLGALLPALDMSRRNTRALLAAFTLHEKAGRFAPALFASALAVFFAVGGWLLLGGWRVQRSGFIAAMAVLAVMPLTTPLLMRESLKRISLDRLGWRYGLKSLSARLAATSFAVASVAVAVSMMVGVTFMIASFRKTVDVWIGQTLKADIYITSPSWRRARESATLDDALVRRLSASADVAKVDRLRQIFATVDGQHIPITGVDMAEPVEKGRVPLVEGDPSAVAANLKAGRILIGEPLLRKHGHKIGDELPMERDGKIIRLPIAAVYFDYGNQTGSVMMSIDTMAQLFGPGPITNLALHLKPGVDPESAVDRLKSATASTPLEIRSNAKLKQEVIRIFDQTFAVTRLLQVMSLLVAGCGIAITLFILARERAPEWALLRSLGATRRQIAAVFITQGLGIGALGLLIGFAGGLLLMIILVFMINRAYFGWTVQLHWPGVLLLEQIATILAVAFFASLAPALRASKITAQELSRDDA
jgi:putative ABC transport system permease protein